MIGQLLYIILQFYSPVILKILTSAKNFNFRVIYKPTSRIIFSNMECYYARDLFKQADD